MLVSSQLSRYEPKKNNRKISFASIMMSGCGYKTIYKSKKVLVKAPKNTKKVQKSTEKQKIRNKRARIRAYNH